MAAHNCSIFYTAQHETVRIISPLLLQTINSERILKIGYDSTSW